jgi:hypothetical protein
MNRTAASKKDRILRYTITLCSRLRLLKFERRFQMLCVLQIRLR